MAWYFGGKCVQICMRVVLCQMKNGLPALTERSMSSRVAARNSSSAVSILFLVSGPVSSQVCLPQGPKRGSAGAGLSVAVALHLKTPRGPNSALEAGVLGVVDVLRLFLGIQVIEVAEKLVEAVHRGQELIAITQMVLAILERHVAEGLQQLGKRGVLLLQSDRRARQTNLGQSGAKRALSGDECCASRRAALLARSSR